MRPLIKQEQPDQRCTEQTKQSVSENEQISLALLQITNDERKK